MRFLYDIFFILFAIGYLPVMLLKGKFHRDLAQRFGFLPGGVLALRSPLWIHAVSVGEAAVAAQLAAKIKEKAPDIPVVVSTTTVTGNEMITRLGKDSVDGIFYYPLDISFIVDRVIRALRPRMYVMIETELWPNLISRMEKNGIPVALVNGRISDSSFGNYMRIRPVIRGVLDKIGLFCTQSEQDRERIVRMGACAEKTAVTGSMKFDETGGRQGEEAFDRSAIGIGKEDKVIMAGSTHFPEEHDLVDIFTEIYDEHPEARLVIVPRHIERCGAIKIYIEKAGFRCALFSDIAAGGKVPDGGVILVDTIGHLRRLYSAADIVFVGGSIARKGGQNPIEAARWKKPVIFGPNMGNFRQVAEMLTGSGGAVRVEDKEHLKSVILDLLKDGRERGMIAEKAFGVIQSNSGATERTADRVLDVLRNAG